MSDKGCLACYAKDITIFIQKQRIAMLTKEVKRLRGLIHRAQAVCASIIRDALKVMEQHQPRAVWAYAKAAKKVAETVLSVLG